MRSWAAQSGRVRGSSFPPLSLCPTPSRHRPPIPRRWAEHTLDHPSQPGRSLGELVDVHALGERATVGMAQLGGDNTGRFLVAAMAEAKAWRSRWGWAASPTPVARRAKARLAWLGLTGVPRSVRNTRSNSTG